MRQELFEKNNTEVWEEYTTILHELGNNKNNADSIRFPYLYRKICNHYAIALSRQYSGSLVDHLHTLVIEGHNILYRKKTFFPEAAVQFIVYEFPALLRAYKIRFIISLLLFVLPALSSGTICHANRDIIYTIMDRQQVSQFEHTYDPSNRKIGRSAKRSSDSDIMMFGFYIRNNVSIGFRTFAGGVLLGIGTLFFLIYNGLVIGSVAGHITGIGYGETFWQFVASHGAFELTAIVISGTAGLILAEQVISPGNRNRTDALKYSAPDALKLMMGAFAMLVIAAFVEAFWSPLRIAYVYKYIFAAVSWCIVICYLVFAGRKRIINRKSL